MTPNHGFPLPTQIVGYLVALRSQPVAASDTHVWRLPLKHGDFFSDGQHAELWLFVVRPVRRLYNDGLGLLWQPSLNTRLTKI